ncbi:mitochondrial ribosomal protein L2 [Brevipalpus obovatus]|uniref:mitochondrial ribosomal protein L2 n=1 Tax=Brevipalpus obovatus TaxID=246614 RepID=UPI003D9FA623
MHKLAASLVNTARNLLNVADVLGSSLINETFSRTRVMFKKPLGCGRRMPHFKKTPVPHKYGWRVHYPKDGEYTYKYLRVKELAGRDPETGHRVVRLGRHAVRRNYLWLDYKFTAPPGETIEEKVYSVRHHPFFTCLAALVAHKGHKRWIIASENMKPGDIIKTTNVIPSNPTQVKEGQILPVGAMPPGTLIHNIELYPGQGGVRCKAAGTHAEILRRLGNLIIIKLPNGNEIAIDQRCFACVGKVSNPEHYTVNEAFPQRMWWKGRHPVLGTKRRKDGYLGRKLHPPKPLLVYDIEKKYKLRKPEVINLDRV